jgi:Predicted endonuclease distantly related to archaeal Holliday junction resolvase
LERNVRLGRLELDLVCRAPKAAGNTLVFVEVKTRGAGSLGSPAEGLTPQKCERLLRAARQYLSNHDLWDSPCRFDLVAVMEHEGRIVAEHIENALSAEDITAASGTTNAKRGGGTSSSWQPW